MRKIFQPPPATARATVVQMGPGLEVHGGVSAVEKLTLEHLGGIISIRHIATMEEGSTSAKLRVFLRAIFSFAVALRAPGPLLVHIHFASRGSTLRKMFLAWMALYTGRPLVLHAHGGAFAEFYDSLPGVARHLLRHTFKRADRLVVLSDRWRSFYVEHCGVTYGKVTVLHNPVRLPPQLPDRRGRGSVQLLYLGHICRSKGAFDLLQAFAGLPEDVRIRARLVFAGDGELQNLRRRAAPLGAAVAVFDWVDAAKRDALLAESDVFVLPSYKEGLPMALLEAMAHGLPVVVTAVGGIPDVVSDGCEGLLVTPGDTPQLQAALRMLIADPARRLELGRRAREHASRFDVARYTDDLLTVYRDLLGRSLSEPFEKAAPCSIPTI